MLVPVLAHSRKPDISFSDNGRIDICSRLTKMLGLEEGDVIGIAADDTSLRRGIVVYVRYKSANVKGNHEARVIATKRTKGRPGNLRAYSRAICSYIFDTAKIQIYPWDDTPISRIASTLKFPVGEPYDAPEVGHCVPIIFMPL